MKIIFTQEEIERIVLDYAINMLGDNDDVNTCNIERGTYSSDPCTASVYWDEQKGFKINSAKPETDAIPIGQFDGEIDNGDPRDEH